MPFIFGYGSLINRHTRTNPNSGDFPARLRDYARGWNAPLPTHNLTALGIVERAGATCNGVLVPVTPELLAEIDVREQSVGYKRKEILWDDLESLNDKALPASDKVFLYVLESPGSPTNEMPIIQTYVDAVLFGCIEYGDSFAREFIRTTELWNAPWINDREHPQYPRWNKEYASPQVDRVIEEELSRPS